MTDQTAPTIPQPFSDYTVLFLLLGPELAGPIPRDADAEVRSVFGAYGERLAQTWTEHAVWLRAAAAARGIEPPWPRGFFAEVVARGER